MCMHKMQIIIYFIILNYKWNSNLRMWLDLNRLWCRWQLIDRLVLLTVVSLYSRCQPNCVLNCVAGDHNCAETLSHRPNNGTAWCRCGWVNVFSNLNAGWSCDCRLGICAAILPNAVFCERLTFVIGKTLFRTRCIWMVSLLSGCTWVEKWEKEKKVEKINKNEILKEIVCKRYKCRRNFWITPQIRDRKKTWNRWR